MHLILFVVLKRWRLIATITLGGALALTVALLLRPRRYEAAVTVASVTSRSGLAGAGLAASFLGAPVLGGVQSTPAFVTRLARMDGVLLKVAHTEVAPGLRFIDSLLGEPAGVVSAERALRAMRRLVSVRADLQTGLVTLSAEHKDSAMARRALQGVLRAAGEAFVEASRAQASMLRTAQDLRVDSAHKRLTLAEERFRQFLGANRIVAPFSEASVVRQRLERELHLAETVHGQAVTDRETAIAKELEETPALVVVDPLPAQLTRATRGIAIRAILLSLLLATGTLAALIALETLVRAKSAGDERAVALWRYLRGDIWLRWYQRVDEVPEARVG